MSKVTVLIENAMVHKETIAPSISGAISNRNHYNANSSIYPATVGRGNYLFDASTANFNGILNKMKRIHGVPDINPAKYFEIKKGVGGILKEISEYEQPIKVQLNSLAEQIIRNYYSVPEEIQFDFEDNSDDFTSPIGSNVIDGYQNQYEDFTFEDYTGVNDANNQIDRDRMNYCLICGGANQAMGLYKSYGDALDSVDYRLHGLYDKFNSFSNFNLWVSPDEILSSNIDDIGGFKIFETETGYRISIDSPNLISSLYEMSKAVLSILFQEKYNNPYVDYENPWNTRVGTLAWNKLIGCAGQKKNFPYVVDAMNQLENDDYSYVMKEVLAGTNHSKKIFEELSATF